MKTGIVIVACIALLNCFSCAHAPAIQPVARVDPVTDANILQSLHIRLVVDPDNGNVKYFGWYDGLRNVVGPNGIVSALVGMEPPEMQGKLTKISDKELRFEGIDQNLIAWMKEYRLTDSSVSVTLKITNRRDQGFDAIVYSLSDLPDSTIKGDNRDQFAASKLANAHFHADIENPNFPGEQMNPFALRSESHHLNPGDSMAFQMTWELAPPARE